MQALTSIVFRGSKILVGTAKNEMVMFDLKAWKREVKGSVPEKYFVSLGNNSASALFIGKELYYVCLSFDKTIAIYQFLGGENKTYFKEHKRFQRNIFKSQASCLHVSPSEQYLITTGSESDTVVDVWSTNGEKLATTNSYQIEHYGMSCGHLNLLVRGWTSEVKIFSAVEEKDGSFKKLDKKLHLANDESPLSAAIDNLDMFAVSLSKQHKVKLWWLYELSHKEVTSETINAMDFTMCALYTFDHGHGRFKPLVILGHEKGFVLADCNLRILKEVEGVEIRSILVTGTSKRVIVGTVSPNGQMQLWNLERELERVEDISV